MSGLYQRCNLLNEFALALGLIFGIYITYVAAVAAIHRTVAAVAVWKLTQGKWL